MLICDFKVNSKINCYFEWKTNDDCFDAPRSTLKIINKPPSANKEKSIPNILEDNRISLQKSKQRIKKQKMAFLLKPKVFENYNKETQNLFDLFEIEKK